jgi:hypothetical protein
LAQLPRRGTSRWSWGRQDGSGKLMISGTLSWDGADKCSDDPAPPDGRDMWSNGDPTRMPWGQDRSGPHWQPLRAILRVSVGVPEVAREAAIAARRLNRPRGNEGVWAASVIEGSKVTARPQGPVASRNPALVALWPAPLPRRWRLRSAISGARDTAYETRYCSPMTPPMVPPVTPPMHVVPPCHHWFLQHHRHQSW